MVLHKFERSCTMLSFKFTDIIPYFLSVSISLKVEFVYPLNRRIILAGIRHDQGGADIVFIRHNHDILPIQRLRRFLLRIGSKALESGIRLGGDHGHPR